MVGSSLFALATVPGFPAWAGAGAANALCFAGSWFFTAAAWLQLQSSDTTVRGEWSCAAVQFVGTVLFNVSTAAALVAHAARSERRYVWAPDAAGSLAFLVSAVIGLGAVAATAGLIAPRSRQWRAAVVNLAGCVAFGVSAAAAHIGGTGITTDQRLANLGTFVGALCFLAAALVVLPRRSRDQAASLQ